MVGPIGELQRGKEWQFCPNGDYVWSNSLLQLKPDDVTAGLMVLHPDMLLLRPL